MYAPPGTNSRDTAKASSSRAGPLPSEARILPTVEGTDDDTGTLPAPPLCPESSTDSIIGGARAPTPASDVDVPHNLQEISDAIQQEAGLWAMVQDFPPTSDYDFDETGPSLRGRRHHKTLFLGEDASATVQAWARIKLFNDKPEEVEFLEYDIAAGRMSVVKDVSTLPLVYPFRVFGENTQNTKKKLTVLIRYIYRCARYIDSPFATDAIKTLKSVIRDVYANYQGQGGMFLAIPDSLILLN